MYTISIFCAFPLQRLEPFDAHSVRRLLYLLWQHTLHHKLSILPDQNNAFRRPIEQEFGWAPCARATTLDSMVYALKPISQPRKAASLK